MFGFCYHFALLHCALLRATDTRRCASRRVIKVAAAIVR
jgi:hypothetical protein